MPTITGTCIQDATGRQSGTSNFDDSGTYTDNYMHTSAANARIVGWRFTIPDTIDTSAITDARVTLIGVSQSGTPTGEMTVESDATSALVAGFYSRYNSDNGVTDWDPVASAGVADATCPNFGSILADAIDGSTASSGVYTVCVFWKADFGSASFARYASIEHATYAQPELTITVSAPTNFDATISVVDPTVTVDALLSDYDVSCTSVSALGTSEGAGTNRKINVYLPRSGTPPPGGWPVVMYCHGGAWTTGSKDITTSTLGIPRAFIEKLIDNGYMVVSVRYRLFSFSEDYSFPQNVHDVRAAMEWFYTYGAANYSANVDKVVLSGVSAGGHLAAFAALSACTDDSDQYTGRQNVENNRPAGYGLSDTASPWKFDFDENGELSSSMHPVGILLWDPPIDLYEMIDHPNPFAEAVLEDSRRILMGRYAFQSIPNGDYDELNVSEYIDGTGVTTYTSAMDPDDIPPIFYMYTTSTTVEDVITNDAGINALVTALTNVSYDVSTSVNVLNTAGGLTKHSTTSIHPEIPWDNGPDYTKEMAWLAEIMASPPLPLHTGSSQVDTLKVGTDDVDALYVGSTQIWP